MSNNSTSTRQVANLNRSSSIDGQAIAELVPIAFLIVVANGLVLVLFARRKHLRTLPNYILFSLAICDFLTGIMNIPLLIIVAFTSVIQSQDIHSYLAVLVSVLNNLAAISSCYHILVATTEKYLSIIWPVTHRLIRRKTVSAVLVLVWLVSTILAFIPFAWVDMEDSETAAMLKVGHVIFCLVAVFLLPYSFMIYAFVVIFRWISNKGKANTKSLSKRQLSRQAALEKRCLILFASMATVYLTCWLPWYILMLLANVLDDTRQVQIPSHVFALVRFATSIINPVLYTFFRRDFRMALKSLLCKMRMQSSLLYKGSERQRLAANVSDETAENIV